MEGDGSFDMLQNGGFSAVLHRNSGTEMDLVRFRMQKEIAIDRQEVSSKGDILVLHEDIRWQHCLHCTWYMLWIDTSALSFEYPHHGSIDSGSLVEIIY